MGIINDLLLFLAIRKVESKIYSKELYYFNRDGGGNWYPAFDFRWCGKTYVCDQHRAERDGVLAAVLYEMNRQNVIAATTPEEMAQL